ncbi:MAG: phenylalanine--tRNA ligase beta subunit-related protein [Thermodesulfobacteriota bacterium]
MNVNLNLSPQYLECYPGTAFGLVLVTGVKPALNPSGFDQYKRQLLRRMRKKDRLAGIQERVSVYDRFFSGFGQTCPLPKHLKRTLDSGFPRYNLLVDAHFLAEMCAGILVAVTDFDRFEGGLTLDVAQAGETCLGMGRRVFTMKAGEIVLRDEKEITCVLCQGADEKTRVSDDTSQVLFYAFGVPGVAGRYLEEGLTIAAEALVEFGQGTSQGVRVYNEPG